MTHIPTYEVFPLHSTEMHQLEPFTIMFRMYHYTIVDHEEI